MKTQLNLEIKAFIFTFIAIFLLILNLSAQKQIISLESFSQIKIEGPVSLNLNKTDQNSIKVENDVDLPSEELFKYSVQDGELNIKSTGKVKDLQLTVNYVELTSITAVGVANVMTQNKIDGESLNVKSEGATELKLDVDVKQLQLNASAATTIRLSGNAGNVTVKSSGASDIKAFDLVAVSASIESSGASDVKMHVTDNASVLASGASNVRFKDKPQDVKADVKGAADVKYGDINVKSEDLIDFPDGFSKEKRKFDGHWAGVELGFNALVDRQLNTGFASEYDFLELNQPKSITVQLNVFEYNVPIIRNNFGLVTGLGLWINNYRFSNNIVLVSDSVKIFGFADTTRNYTKSKLTASYLALPLIFEYQFRDKKDKEVFHVGVGGYGAVKLGSKTKNVYLENDRKTKVKDHNDFKINPFKYGLTARLGWRQVNFFANYNLSTIFEKNKGPETYPFEVGLTLVGW